MLLLRKERFPAGTYNNLEEVEAEEMKEGTYRI